MSDDIVILGAGALSLGFFGPELCKDYRLTFLDTQAKADLVAAVQKCGEYTMNLAGKTIMPVTVGGVRAFRLDLPEHDAAIRERIGRARIFFTAVGIRNLESALSYLYERIKDRSDSIYILCAENGENIAERWRARFSPNVHLCDTVMGRMSRLEEPAGPDYAPVSPDIAWGVVAEEFYGMPLSDEYYDATVFHSKAFQFVSKEEFHARDRIKLYAHNGLHFFVAAQGRLRNVARFSDLASESSVTGAARALLDEEIAPALWKDCGWRLGRRCFDEYMAALPGRLFSVTLRDQIARGVRGVLDKFAENERVMGGLRLLLANGIRPNRYCDLIAAGLEVARRDVSPEAADALLARLPSDEIRREVAARWSKLKN